MLFLLSLCESDDAKGIPEFWLTAMKNVDMLADMIQVCVAFSCLALLFPNVINQHLISSFWCHCIVKEIGDENIKNPHERYELNKLTSLPMCGFIAQLVEHRTGIAEVTGSNPVEALIFFASSFQLLKLENLLR